MEIFWAIGYSEIFVALKQKRRLEAIQIYTMCDGEVHLAERILEVSSLIRTKTAAIDITYPLSQNLTPNCSPEVRRVFHILSASNRKK